MLKRISARQLRVGMYLEEFCCSWIDHPFWRSGFVITDTSDLDRIRESRVSEVWIDTAKGLDTPPGLETVSAEEAESRVEAELQQIAREDLQEPAKQEFADYPQAAELCSEAKQQVFRLFEQARMGKTIDTAGANRLVGQIVDSVARNRCAMTSLVRMKSASEFTYMHSVAVCVLMIALARRLGLNAEETRSAGLAGLLHDLGKAAIPLDVLHKPGKLSDTEYRIVKRHPEEGSRILNECGINGAALDVCLNHHARIDGGGYPQRIQGNEISRYARMAAICDVYDAISSDRPYKQSWDPAECMRKMAEWTSGQLDPVIFHAFVKCIGIYPVGSLVRLSSQRLGVVIGQSSSSLLTPRVRVFFSLRKDAPVPAVDIDLSDPACTDAIEAREDLSKWHFPDLAKQWSGLAGTGW